MTARTMKTVRILVAALIAALSVECAARTSKECRDEISQIEKEIKKLDKELSNLKKQSIVKYAEKEMTAGNIQKRMGKVIEINRRFRCGYHKGVYHEWIWSRERGHHDSVCSRCSSKYYEWKDLNGKINSSRQTEKRMEIIKTEIKELKEKKSELVMERYELLKEEEAEKKKGDPK